MKTLIENIKNYWKPILIILGVGISIGFLFGQNKHSNHQKSNQSSDQPIKESIDQTWTCSMHPQIKQEKPGDCPICGMDLIPLAAMNSGGDNIDPNEIMLTESAAKLAEIQTISVRTGIPVKTIDLQGKIQADERRIAVLTARFGGRIEKLFVNYTGQQVKKGEKLATIYSPDLVTAQRELLEAVALRDSRPGLYSAAKGKLKLWDLNDEQIEAIEEKGSPTMFFDILSPITGTVTLRQVAIGDYVQEGKQLFKVVDLSKLWALFDAYESDLPWIKTGDKVEFSIHALPGKTYSGKVAFIDPFIDAKTRVAKVRVELDNARHDVKPEMFARGIVYSPIETAEPAIVIPKTALLWTGKRAVVYVKVPEREQASFLYREIVLGPEAGNSYVVKSGLKEGEEIAVNGVFKIDAAAQLQGLASMMNPKAEALSTGHNHGEMQMISGEKGEHTSFKVGGNCEMCKDRIEEAALTVSGLKEANWNSETLELSLKYDAGTSISEVHKAIAMVGHDTEEEKAPNEVYNELPECCLYERFDYATSNTTKPEHSMFKVYGNCGMCQSRIEEAALSVTGVESASWDSETEQLHLNFDASTTTVAAVQKAIAAAGHDTENFKAPIEVYNELPECCLYRENNE